MRVVFAALLLAGLSTAVYWAGAESGARAERALRGSLREAHAGARSGLEAALGIPEARARARRLAEYFDQAGSGDLDAILGAYEAAEVYIDAVALVLLADWWASFDPAGAFERSLGWRYGDADVARFTIVRSWARQEPAAARRVVDEARGSPGADLLTQALVVGWAEGANPSGVWTYLENLPMGLDRQKALLALIARSFAARGVDETLRTIEALPDDGVRRFKLQAYRRTAWALARYDPERARQWAARHAAGPFGKGLLRLVGVSRVPVDGASTLAWLQTTAPGEERDEAVFQSYRTWLAHDRAAAMGWLRDAEPDSALEPALVLLVSATARDDPQQALPILARIQDPGLRESGHVFLARAWMTHDRAAALAWLETAPVTEETRRHVLEGGAGMPAPRRSESPSPSGA